MNFQKSLPTIEPNVWNALMNRLLSVSIRSHIKNSRSWTVEIIFYETPLKSKHQREQGEFIERINAILINVDFMKNHVNFQENDVQFYSNTKWARQIQ